MKEEKISFKKLTWPIKTAVISAWVVGIYLILAIIFGFLLGFLGLINFV